MLVGGTPPARVVESVQEPKRKPGRPRKEAQESKTETQEQKPLPLFEKARTWTKEEAEERRERVKTTLEGYFQDTDNILVAISKKPQSVWSNMTDDEMTLLVDFALLRAQNSKEAARTLDLAMEYRLYAGVAAALLPRFYATIAISVEALILQIQELSKPQKRGRVVDASLYQR